MLLAGLGAVALGIFILIIFFSRGTPPASTGQNSGNGINSAGTGGIQFTFGGGGAASGVSGGGQPTATSTKSVPAGYAGNAFSGSSGNAGVISINGNANIGVSGGANSPTGGTVADLTSAVNEEYQSYLASHAADLGFTPSQLNGILSGMSDSNLPPAIRDLLNKPGGPTINDVIGLQAESQTQYNDLTQEIKSIGDLVQASPSADTTDQCEKVMTDLKSYVSVWGGSADSSVLGQIPACASFESQLSPVGFPNIVQ